MSDGTRRHPHVVNIDEIEMEADQTGTRFAHRERRLGRAVGATGIGCRWYEVPPGCTAFPFHYHCVNEEALYILDGEGTLRIGEQKVPLRPGDYVALPTGPASAHQLLNTGAAPLRYLCLSTLSRAEVCGYPDSRKLAAMATPAPGAPASLQVIFREETTVDYYDREDID
jgi:uncharacterized cupin superfamily protein